ncbi:hypothetical protein L1987_42853 [Smallanthus sonchifolius]|uniref:Uncharacterized protein n=1 Tax=Smallanthus sonchifolius TaxID=185202 RepID=A0ACB9GK44_9ASTR|nr:hypothetical protein L1987_42853 [Smallanthus sonchifolius]
MTFSSSSRFFLGFLVVLWSGRLYANECYSSIISFGDSIADTGNLKQLASIYSNLTFACTPPYGQDFIGQSTGRCSNGRLIIDFLAESLGLPLIPPYFNGKGSDDVAAWRQGVNYAVGTATALDSSFSEAQSGEYSVINASLGVQLAWFKQSLPSICDNTSDCRNFIGRSLILVGEIGGNDYNHPLRAGKSIDEIKPYVPLVIDTIISTVNELIEMGARTLVVPGNFPIGCFPSYLTIYKSDNKEYDPITSCLAKLNEFVEYHNKMLQTKLNEIRELNLDVAIIYADYYNSVMQIYRSPYEYGFTNNGTLKACCGCGGPFNYNLTGRCGDACTTVCDEPDSYVSWDGIHLTEHAYKLIFKSLFQGLYTTPEFYSMCPTSSQVGIELSSSI